MSLRAGAGAWSSSHVARKQGSSRVPLSGRGEVVCASVRRTQQQGDVPLVEADVIHEEIRLPVSGRGAGPVVFCMAPPESSAVTLADPPASADDSSDMPTNDNASAQYGEMQVTDDNVDSRRYVREVINLSVDLDSAETRPEEDEAVEEYSTGLGLEISDDLVLEGFKSSSQSQVSDARLGVRELMSNFDPNNYVGDRHHWMVIIAPEAPMAGEDCIILFNRQQSEMLRERPGIYMSYGFNAWGLKGDNGQPFKATLAPAPMPKEYSDFWWARIKVPEQAYELNFVLSDGESAYENNLGQDFTYGVTEGWSWEQWQAHLAAVAQQREMEKMEVERKRAAEETKARLQKEEAERKAREEDERKRLASLKVEAFAKGKQRATDMHTKGLTKQFKDNDPTKPLLWTIEPSEARVGSTVKLYYNKSVGMLDWLNVPLDKTMSLRWGHNWWQDSQSTEMTRCDPPAGATAGDWWVAEIQVPVAAGIVNFVIQAWDKFDNNKKMDYALKVLPPIEKTFDQWITEMELVLGEQEWEVRIAAEAEAKQREMRRSEARKKAMEQVLAVERRKVRHVLYTEPEIIQAGEEVTLWYNPQDTPLNGKQQIYLLAGFNRWGHPTTIGPLPLIPPDLPPEYDHANGTGLVRSGSPTHWKATFVVPHDAYKLDFVFSDVAGGEGTYDNRGGYDYHLPVTGSQTKDTSLYVAHIAVEMAPIAKVGGLGDVVTALGRAVQEQGHLVEVILPKYEFFNSSPMLQGQLRYETEFDWGGTRIFVTTAVVENLRVWFIEPRNGFFSTQTVYGRYDDEVRFDFFCKAALEFLLRTQRQPDILHCHDWSTAHVAKSYWDDYHPYGLWKPKVIFTIHNMNYGQKKLSEAAYYCQKFTTVSPTYAFEVGGTAVVGPHLHKFCGIRNGIDNDLWDPEGNRFLPAPISPENVVKGKAAARAELRSRLNLTTWNDKFIVACVSRLTSQKGMHLIKHAAFRAIDRGGQFVLLGSAPDPKVQADFNGLAASMGGQDSAFCFKYDEPLSHLIYAAADMIVVPSMFEPCGLTQMIAMRYGAVPIVRHTGGLKDTVFDVDFDKGRAAWELYGSSDWQRDSMDATNGFAFTGTDPDALDYAMNRAIDAWYNDRAWFHSLQQRIMLQDWSWNRPALDYIELYYSATKTEL